MAYGGGLLSRCRGNPTAGSTPAASARRLLIADFRMRIGKIIGPSSLGSEIRNLKSAIDGTCSSAELERDSAKVEVARSNRARSANSKSSYGVAELERREFLKLVLRLV